MSVTTGTFPGVRIVDMPDLGAFTDNSSIVGEHAGSGRFSAFALRDYIGRNIVSVLDHGAFGDGSHDDTAAIQAVLNTYAGKAIVLFPRTAQAYMVDTLFPPSDSSLLVMGMLKSRPNLAEIPGKNVAVVSFQTVNNCSISGTGTLDGNGVNQTFGGCAGLAVDHASNIHITQVTLQNAAQWNFNCTASTGVVVDGITMLGGTNSPEFASDCEDCWLMNSYIDGPRGDGGFAFYGGIINSGAIGNVFTNAKGNGCSVVCDPAQNKPCHGIVISDNLIFNNGADGIDVLSSGVPVLHTKIMISNNVLYGNNTALGANAFPGMPPSDIWVSSAEDVMISSNKCCESHQSHGITIGGAGGYQASWRVTVTGNDISNEGQGTATGVGIFLAALQGADIAILGNHIYDDQATPTMLHAVSGGCGTRTAITGNHFGAFGGTALNVTTNPDTVVANSGNGLFAVTGGTFATSNPITHATANSLPRWFTGRSGVESGGNTGSDYSIIGVDDSNALIGTAFTISRATSNVTIGLGSLLVAGAITVNGGLVFGSIIPPNYANDGAAAAGGVGVGHVYRNGSALMVRVA